MERLSNDGLIKLTRLANELHKKAYPETHRNIKLDHVECVVDAMYMITDLQEHQVTTTYDRDIPSKVDTTTDKPAKFR